jgi:hypothetical protein
MRNNKTLIIGIFVLVAVFTGCVDERMNQTLLSNKTKNDLMVRFYYRKDSLISYRMPIEPDSIYFSINGGKEMYSALGINLISGSDFAIFKNTLKPVAVKNVPSQNEIYAWDENRDMLYKTARYIIDTTGKYIIVEALMPPHWQTRLSYSRKHAGMYADSLCIPEKNTGWSKADISKNARHGLDGNFRIKVR